MAQWVKVGNIRGPAGEIPDVSDFVKFVPVPNMGDTGLADASGELVKTIYVYDSDSGGRGQLGSGNFIIQSFDSDNPSKNRASLQFTVLRSSDMISAYSQIYTFDAAGGYAELGFGVVNGVSRFGAKNYPVDEIYAADLDDAASDKRVPNKKYVDDAIEGMLTGDSGFITRDEDYILKTYIADQLYNLPQLNLRGNNTGGGYINATANTGGGVIELGGNSTSKVELQSSDDGGYIRLKTLFDNEPEIATNGKLTISDKSINSITDDASSGSTTALATAKAVKDYADGLVSFVTDEQIDEYLGYDPSVTIPFDLINNEMGTCSCSIDETGTVSVFGGTISWGNNLTTAYNTWATIPDVTVPAAYRPTSDTILDNAANSGGTYLYDVRFNTDGTIDIRRNNYPSYPPSYITNIAISGKHTYQSTPPALEDAPDLGNGIMTAEQVLSRLGGGSVEKLFEGTAMTKSVSDDYTIFVLQLFNSNYTTIQVFPRHTARYAIPNPTYNNTYVKLDMDVTWSISAQTVTFESTSNSIELIYGIK